MQRLLGRENELKVLEYFLKDFDSMNTYKNEMIGLLLEVSANSGFNSEKYIDYLGCRKKYEVVANRFQESYMALHNLRRYMLKKSKYRNNRKYETVLVNEHINKRDFRVMTRILFSHLLPKVCSRCGTDKDLTIHHLKYSYPIKMEDLLILCRRCHGKEEIRIKNSHPLIAHGN
jgi:hypothetical protein